MAHKANDALTVAERLTNPSAREHMLAVVASYRRLAQLVERSPACAPRPTAANDEGREQDAIGE